MEFAPSCFRIIKSAARRFGPKFQRDMLFGMLFSILCFLVPSKTPAN
jgi:hypothetical protein